MKKIGRYIFIALLIGAVGGTFYFLWKKSQPKLVVYEEVSPTMEDIITKTVATGRVEPRDEINVKPQISGIISELLKEAGQSVREGEVIARIKVIPEIVQLSSAESRLRLSDIALEQAEPFFARQENLYNSGVISLEEYQRAQADIRRSREEREYAAENLELIRRGISSRLASASSTQVTATTSGMILDIPIKVGSSVIQSNTFNDGTTIATVADMTKMIFRGKVDETEVGKIHENMPILLTIGALNNMEFDAVIEYVSPKGVVENGAVMFEIKAAVAIPDDITLRSGYSANAEIVVARIDNVLSIPESCIEFVGDSSFVYVLQSVDQRQRQEFGRRHIRLGNSNGISVQVTEGLAIDEKIRGTEVTTK